MLERPLIGGRRVPIKDPVWESFDQYRAEHRAAVARREAASQGGNRNQLIKKRSLIVEEKPVLGQNETVYVWSEKRMF